MNADPKKAEQNAKYRRENPERAMWLAAKHRAKRKGIPFSVELAEIKIPEVCPLLGIPLIFGEGSGHNESSPTLDKLVPALGYVSGNVLVVSGRANRLKSDATADELERIASKLRELQRHG